MVCLVWRVRWTHLKQENKVGYWNPAETARLCDLVHNYNGNRYKKWLRISSELATNRTAEQCRGRWLTLSQSGDYTSEEWTQKEDDVLREQVKEFGVNDWVGVASGLKGRSAKQARARWIDALGGDKNRASEKKVRYGKWTKEEDGMLTELIERYGQRWSTIAENLPKRTARQIVARWNRTLKPEIKVYRWSQAEDEKLRKLVSMLNHKWTEISKELPGRTPYNCRDRWVYVLDSRWNKGAWNAEEDQRFIDALPGAYDPNFNWQVASEKVKTRSRKQCSEHYRALLRKGAVKQIDVPKGESRRNSPKIYTARDTRSSAQRRQSVEVTS